MNDRFYNQKKLIAEIVNALGGENGVEYNGITYRFKHFGGQENSQFSAQTPIGSYNFYPESIVIEKSEFGVFQYVINLKVQLMVDSNFNNLNQLNVADEFDLAWLMTSRARLPGISSMEMGDVSYMDTGEQVDNFRIAEFVVKFKTYRNYQ